MNSMLKGTMIATAVAGLVGCANNTAAPSAAAPSGVASGKVKCTGLNACKGHGACGQADHACGGKNECKGKGITLVGSAEDCTTKGGKTL